MTYKAGYYISSGALGKMFTLRRWSEEPHYTGELRVYDHHMKTLSNDLEKAKAKAVKMLGDIPFEVRITEVGTITRRNLGPKDHTELPYCLPPNYSGVSFKDKKFKPGQLFWAWGQINYQKAYKKTADLLLEHLKEMKAITMDGEEWALTSFVEAKKKRKEEAAKSDFVGQVTERLKDVKLTMSAQFSFEGFYGVTWVNIMTDTNYNVFVYKGSFVDAEKGEKLTLLAGTVKEHTIYKDTKQTVINRPKFEFHEPAHS